MKRQSKIRYKAIKRKTRTSAMIHGNSKYGLKYLPDTEVFAMPHTLGIFTFKTKTAAEDWVDVWNSYHSFDMKDLIYVPVIPLGRGRNIVFASSCLDPEGLDYYYKEGDDFYDGYGEVPDNTMVFPGVYVVE